MVNILLHMSLVVQKMTLDCAEALADSSVKIMMPKPFRVWGTLWCSLRTNSNF